MNDHDQKILDELAAEIAAECGVMPSDVTVHVCGQKCEHAWDAWVDIDNGASITSTQTCSKCGATAFDVCMLEMP